MTDRPGANLRIHWPRLKARLDHLAEIGAAEGGACCRLALTDADKAGRDLVVGWMRELGLKVHVDMIGNIIALRPGRSNGSPVMTGSHIDTVRTGGKYDGNYGVLGALEAIATLNGAGITPDRPLAIGVFTNEEGARFAPDMLGSLVYAGGLPLAEALDARGSDGARLGDELARIGYAGDLTPGEIKPHAYVELHIEQGPILDAEGITIGAVENLQGISWQEISIVGQSNHAGTTPMRLRRDAGYTAAAIALYVRGLVGEMGGNQVGTVGVIELHPNLINVIAAKAKLTVDLRNTDEPALQEAERRLQGFLHDLARMERVEIATRRLTRFEPVIFDSNIVAVIEETADALGLSHRRMTSGAGHDAQMLARICPTAMIFTPSVEGISHNPAEHTDPADLEAGANMLLHTLLRLAG